MCRKEIRCNRDRLVVMSFHIKEVKKWIFENF